MLHNLKLRLSDILRVFGPSAFAISIIFNILTILRLRHNSVDDGQYSMSGLSLQTVTGVCLTPIFDAAYIGDDHPIELPLDLDIVALTFEDSKHYSTSGPTAWSEWDLLDSFPEGHGFVRLGPNGK
jgi:hypothetical protein